MAAALQWQADQAAAWARGDAFAGAAAAFADFHRLQITNAIFDFFLSVVIFILGVHLYAR